MRILVTGGAGFIGSHVVDAYLAAGHEVSVVDNLSTGKLANLNPAATLCQADIRDPEGLGRAFAAARPEVVVHQAALADVRAQLQQVQSLLSGGDAAGAAAEMQRLAHAVQR